MRKRAFRGLDGVFQFGFAMTNENLQPYGLLTHTHMPEMATTIEQLSKGAATDWFIYPTFGSHDTRGVGNDLLSGQATSDQCKAAARDFYHGRAFVRVTDSPPQTKWATGSNFAFLSYAADPARNLVIAMGVLDNLGKGAAGQALQNANLIFGLPETAGLDSIPVWP